MTLIQTMNIGGLITLVVSDTRQTMNFFGIAIPYKDSTDKVKRISNHCIYGGGGDTDYVDFIREKVAGQAEYLEDYESVLIRAKEQAKHRFEGIEKIYQIFISGFFANGQSGQLTFTSDEDVVHFQVFEEMEESYSLIAPSADEIDTALSQVSMPEVTSLDELPQAALEYATAIQRAFYENDSLTVSDKSRYSMIFKPPYGDFKYFEGTLEI